MRANSTSLLVLLGLLAFLAGTSALPLTKENITFTLGGLGDITGVVGRTMVKPTSAPYSNCNLDSDSLKAFVGMQTIDGSNFFG